MKIITAENKQEMGRQAAQHGSDLIRRAIRKWGCANIVVATGASQFDMLETLVKEKIEWNRVTGFHLDEYVGLPITHGASFRRYLWERFVSELPLPLVAFHYIQGSRVAGNGKLDPDSECRRLN